MKKVTIIGAGFVGGTTAMRVAESGLAEVVLIDVLANVAQAKAFDLHDARYSRRSHTHIEGTADMAAMTGSEIVVVTAGLARKPGMTREDLLLRNAEILKTVCAAISLHAPKTIVVIVSNPLDVMTYTAARLLNLPRERVFGMGVSLDSARFANLIAQKVKADINDIRALVVGSHGETMLPLPRLSGVSGRSLSSILKPGEVDDLVLRTKKRGAEIVGLYGSGSAYFGPSAAIFEIVQAILIGPSREIPVSVVLQGEYGLTDVSIGVPAKIGSGGVEEIIEIDFEPAEQRAFLESVASITDMIELLRKNTSLVS